MKATWRADHWWSKFCELRLDDGPTIGWLNLNTGQAELSGRRLQVTRDRLLGVKVVDEATGEFAASMDLKLDATLAGFGVYRLGWVKWWKRQWQWCDASGNVVAQSRHRWLGCPLQIDFLTDGPLLLGLLEIAWEMLAVPSK